MGLQELRYATSIFFLVFTFFLSLRFDLWSFVAYRSSQRLILTHIAVAKEGVCCMSLLVCLGLMHIVVTQLGIESVCCLLQSVYLVLTHVAVTIAVTVLGIESVFCISKL
jgi:hypothetical protein